MAEELKGLIEKINEEGVNAAEAKAKKIEDEARARAGRLVERAEKEAAALISSAKERISRLEAGSQTSLKQAARDLLIELRKEISGMLDDIIVSHVHKALGQEEMTRLIISLIKDCGTKSERVVITARKEDLDKFEKGVLNELRGEVKKGVTLKASDDIGKGFRISYDEGKSYYDFTDQAISDYLGSQLKPRLAAIFKETP